MDVLRLYIMCIKWKYLHRRNAKIFKDWFFNYYIIVRPNRFIFEQSVLDPSQVIVEAQINDSDFERVHCFDLATDVSNMSGVSQETSPKWIPPLQT